MPTVSTQSSVTFSDPKGILFFFSSSKMAAYSRRAPNTMMMQTTRYRSIAFKLDEIGASALLTVLVRRYGREISQRKKST